MHIHKVQFLLTWLVFASVTAFADETVVVPTDTTTVVPAAEPTVVAAPATAVVTTPATQAVVTTPSTAVVPVTTTKEVIVTKVPPPQQVVEVPTGYVNCFNVAAGWYKDVWTDEHQVCQYPGTGNVAWVDGYWSCPEYQGSSCTNWQWVSGHWAKTLVVY